MRIGVLLQTKKWTLRSPRRKVIQGVLCTLMLGALMLYVIGAGAGQALSSPAAAQIQAGFCSASEQSYCNQYCKSLYPRGALARCTRYASGPSCNCVPF